MQLGGFQGHLHGVNILTQGALPCSYMVLLSAAVFAIRYLRWADFLKEDALYEMEEEEVQSDGS